MSTKNEAPPPGIHAAMSAAMREVESVGKSRKNEQQGYKFRGIDDVYNVVHQALSNQGITTPPRVLERVKEERQTKSGGVQIHVTLKVEYDFTAPDGSIKTVGPIYAEALDTSDKATNKAMSFAHKYTLLQTFCIPTEDIAEGDRQTVEAAPKRGPEAIPSAGPPKEVRAKPVASARKATAASSADALTDDELVKSIMVAEDWLSSTKPNDPRRNKASARLDALKAEMDKRQRAHLPNPDTGEVPLGEGL